MVDSCPGCYRTKILDLEIVVVEEVLCNVVEVQLDYLGHMVECEDESKGKKIVDSHLCGSH